MDLPYFLLYNYNEVNMEKEEYIAYLGLRAEECGYPDETLKEVQTALDLGDLKLFDQLHRISEPEFRKWCLSISKEKS
jgi:hypothetical protein